MVKKIVFYLMRHLLPQRVFDKLLYKHNMKYSQVFQIIKNPDELFEHVYHIKDASWENMTSPEVYHISAKFTAKFYHAAQNILKVDDAIVTGSSDIVQTKQGVLWDKALQDNFTSVIPLDRNLLKYDSNTARIKKNKIVLEITDPCISLLGVHEAIWAHFIIQFFPKLYVAVKGGLLKDPLTIILPGYTDKNIIELIENFKKDYPHVRIIEVHANQSVKCKTLYYIPTCGYLANHGAYTNLSSFVIPSYVSEIICKYIAEPYINMIKDNPVKFDKIFLIRRGSYRNLTNIEEVERCFADKGFFFVEGADLSLTQKADLLYHAKYIVGPYSSAWTNTFFVNHAKGLLFTNVPRMNESYYQSIPGRESVEFLHLTGEDIVEDSIIHCNYHIDLSRIEEAYNYLLDRK